MVSIVFIEKFFFQDIWWITYRKLDLTTAAAEIISFRRQEVSMTMLTFLGSAVLAGDVDIVEVTITTLHCFWQTV
jgi:hypothetical protein